MAMAEGMEDMAEAEVEDEDEVEVAAVMMSLNRKNLDFELVIIISLSNDHVFAIIFLLHDILNCCDLSFVFSRS